MKEILRLALPITVWLVGFTAVYALQGLSCSRHWPADMEARPALLAVWAIGIAAQSLCLAVLIRAPSRSRFVQTTAISLAVTALVSTIWTMAPVLAVTSCE